MTIAKDLRIGNLVMVDNPKSHPQLNGVILEVTSISETKGIDNENTYGVGLKHINQQPYTYYETYSQFIEFIQPIKLTEEILLKCGLKRNIHCEFMLFEHSEVPILISDTLNDWTVDGICFSVGLLKYLHQLQNLMKKKLELM